MMPHILDERTAVSFVLGVTACGEVDPAHGGVLFLDQFATGLGLGAAAVATLLAEMVILGLVVPTGDGPFARR